MLADREAKYRRHGFDSGFVEVELNGHSLPMYFIEKGEPRAPVILLLHGLGGTASNWIYTSPLSEHYRIIAVDHPDFGLSGRFASDQDFTFDNVMRLYEQFLDKMFVEKVACVVGSSMGGVIATHLAHHLGSRVEHLALVAPGGIGKEINSRSRLLSWAPNFMLDTKHWHIVENWLNRRGQNSMGSHLFADPILGRRLAADAFDNTDHDAAWIAGHRRAVNAGIGKFGQKKELIGLVLKDLRELHCPVLIVWGNRDNVIPPKHGHRLKEIVPDSKLVLFKNCGHLPHIERSGQFNRVLHYFICGEDFDQQMMQEQIFAHIV